MNPSDLKKHLGLIIQTERLASEQGLLKLIKVLQFEKIRDYLDLIDAVNMTSIIKRKLTSDDFLKVDDYICLHEKNNIHVISFGDEHYPLCLAMTPNPPAMLYIKGDLSILNEFPAVAIVGSRDVSKAGEEITRRITSIVSAENLSIVSGLALGTDTNAHWAALNAGAKTIAVLAHGLEVAKPRANAKLADEILSKGGAWISEYPIGRPAFKQSFVQRNRIQVGLSAVSILIEAAVDSGTMTQADFSLKANRPIFAVVPHKPYNPLGLNCDGNIQLVMQGKANPLRTKYDYANLINVIHSSRSKICSNSRLSVYGDVGSLI